MDMEHTPVSKLLLKLSPPVMLSLLIQSVYNIVDSFFIARYQAEGLTALSIIYPMQILMVALATGTGAGVNILLSRMDGQGQTEQQHTVIISGLVLNVIHSLLFAAAGVIFVSAFFHMSSDNELVCRQGILYAKIVFGCSAGMFTEAVFTKTLQARGNMMLPMAAQVTGAVINMILDPIFIFGMAGVPEMGMKGAALATVIGQWAAMVIVAAGVLRANTLHGKWSGSMCVRIYRNGIGSIVTQSLYTLYMVGLNMILKLFSEDAVTVLGIYYKIQSFFFIPLLGFQQVLLPVVSYNYGARKKQRIRQTIQLALILSCGLMLAATLVFLVFPRELLLIFSPTQEILSIGSYALRVIALSFIPAGVTIVATTHLQGIARMKESVFVIVLRQVILLVPMAWLLHYLSLEAVWWTFPLTEIVAAAVCIIFEKKYL
ncbi:MAG: MATE family efflux transporter [Eubacteriales bacterium]|nr:MATE family efflux transporter [Eubacteriales bacterium]